VNEELLRLTTANSELEIAIAHLKSEEQRLSAELMNSTTALIQAESISRQNAQITERTQLELKELRSKSDFLESQAQVCFDWPLCYGHLNLTLLFCVVGENPFGQRSIRQATCRKIDADDYGATDPGIDCYHGQECYQLAARRSSTSSTRAGT
jgi:hypothetical protein